MKLFYSLFLFIFCNNSLGNLLKSFELELNKISVLRQLEEDRNTTIFNQLIDEFLKFLMENSNTEILIEDIWENYDCRLNIFNLATNNSYLYNIFQYSGKSFSDIGLEEECKDADLYYLFLEFDTNLTVFLNYTEYYYLYTFLEETKFYSGYCLPKQCYNFYLNFLKRDKNPQFFEYVKEYGIENIVVYSSHDEELKIELFCIVILLLVLVYILVKLIFSIVGFVVFQIPEEDKYLIEDRVDEDESCYSSTVNIERNSKLDNIFLNKNSISNKNTRNYSKTKMILYGIFKYLNFKSNFKYLMTLKNKYYDETGLEYISYLRAFILFWLIFNHNLYGLIRIPHRDFTNYDFYSSIWFTIIRYSTFSTECWIMLDAFVVVYKLMSYLKKCNENNPIVKDYSFRIFLKFYLLTSTKIFLYFFTFFILHVYLAEFVHIFKDTPIFEYYTKSINNNRECRNNPYTILIPFYLQYTNYSSRNTTISGFKNCYRFVQVLSNEFYVFTIVMIIFYFAHKLKSRIFDFTIILLAFANFFCIFLTFPKFKEEEYTLSWVLGENLSLQYTHIFISTYMLGIFTGLIYFYFNDIVSSRPLESEDKYIPFSPMFTIMKFFDRSTKNIKLCYFFISIFIQILISMLFYFYIVFYNETPKSSRDDIESPEQFLNIKINNLIYFFYIYEKKIFVLFFVFMMLSILLYPKSSTTQSSIQDYSFFNIISRQVIASICITDSCVYMFHSLYNMQIYLNYQNMFIITIGLFIIISTIGIFFVILFELPFRMLYKQHIFNANRQKIKI